MVVSHALRGNTLPDIDRKCSDCAYRSKLDGTPVDDCLMSETVKRYLGIKGEMSSEIDGKDIACLCTFYRHWNSIYID